MAPKIIYNECKIYRGVVLIILVLLFTINSFNITEFRARFNFKNIFRTINAFQKSIYFGHREATGDPKLFVVTKNAGRLGNQMFHLASLIGFAHDFNYVPACKTENQFEILGSDFNIPDAVLEECRTKFGMHKRLLNLSDNFDEEGSNISKTESHSSEPIIVGIHTRRCDSVNLTTGKMPTSEYFVKQAINYVISDLKTTKNLSIENLLFLMFGDDRNWNLQFVKSLSDSWKVERNSTNKSMPIIIVPEQSSPTIDLCQLTLCDRVIITTATTFGWWAGFLAGPTKPVYYPQYYYKKDSIKLANEINYMMPNWIMIKADWEENDKY